MVSFVKGRKRAMVGLAVVVAAVAALQWWPGDQQAASGAPIVSVKEPAEFTSLEQAGKAAFEASCAACHGEAAAGLEGTAPPLVHKIYEPSHHGDAAFYIAATRGVRAHHWRFGDMPPVDGVTENDLAGIVAYVRRLQRENGIN